MQDALREPGRKAWHAMAAGRLVDAQRLLHYIAVGRRIDG